MRDRVKTRLTEMSWVRPDMNTAIAAKEALRVMVVICDHVMLASRDTLLPYLPVVVLSLESEEQEPIHHTGASAYMLGQVRVLAKLMEQKYWHCDDEGEDHGYS
jgi:hypothetical protein